MSDLKNTEKKEISYMSNGKGITTHLIAGLIKEILYKMSQYFPPYGSPRGNIKVELD